MDNHHLTVAALLDPRFHRLTTVSNNKLCLDILTKKYHSICEHEGISDIEHTEEDANKTKANNSGSVKKSSELKKK